MTGQNEEQNDTVEVSLIAMAHGGSALGRHAKQTIFIPYTIPGETVEARIIQDKGRIAFAEGVTLIEASADRVFPECPHFGLHKCGSCHWQHINPTAQVLLKQDVLVDQLARVGKFDDDTIETSIRDIVPSEAQWGYNYQMTFQVENGKLGFPQADGQGIILISECHILHPTLLEIYDSLEFDFTGVQRITFQLSTDDEHMLILYVDDEENIPELHAELATSINVILPDNEPMNLIGNTHLNYTIGEHQFRVTAGSAFRANINQLETLAHMVLDALDLREDASVLDLYAGVGFFSAFIAPHVSLVTLVESFPPAVTDADENLAHYDNVDIVEGTVEDVLPELDDSYECAVLDPPSSGLSVDVLDCLKEKNIPRLVYISGDPATLARDSARLVKQGYQLESVQPIDLAPQTYYIDSVAVFSK